MSKNTPEKSPPSPEPERLKIDGDWESAVGKALKKKPPAKSKGKKKSEK